MTTGCDASTKPYLQYEFSAEKLNKDCSKMNDSFKMNSNTNGERFVFEACLKSHYQKIGEVKRQNDTLVILFEPPEFEPTIYEVTLDVDTYPAYNFIWLNGSTYKIVHAPY
jgi:hypothetical protein